MPDSPSYDYSYVLPEDLIASRPAEPRDSSRLFVYDASSDKITFDVFSNIDNHVPPRSMLVLNDTKVVPARAELKKETGGKVEILFLVNEWDKKGPVPALSDRKLNVGAKLCFDPADPGTDFTVARQDENIFYLAPQFPAEKLFAMLDARGVTPVPKYIKHIELGEAALRERYQTVFGKNPSSVAAPTASLHFTDRVFGKLEAKGIAKTFVTLNVGLGTFAPVSEENLAQGKLHEELITISPEARRAIREQKERGLPVLAAGTTVVRTLESAAAELLAGPSGSAAGAPIAKGTDIFIRPPYNFKIVDTLITNFHLPGTSLMMLVQAFLARKGAERTLVELYEVAIKEKFRFYSFGDAMLIK